MIEVGPNEPDVGIKDAPALVYKDKIDTTWDPRLTNPIFFGYQSISVLEHEKKTRDELEERKKAEIRAVEKAKSMRLDIIENFSKVTKGQANERMKKIEELERRYTAQRTKREEDFARNKRDLPSGAFKIFKLDWDNEFNAAEAAFNQEVGGLRQIHEEKTAADQEALFEKREDLEAFKDAEEQEMPAAERLMEIAKIEVARWIEELDTRSQELEKQRKQYNDLRVDLEKTQALLEKARGNQQAKALQGEIAELRQVINAAESEVRTAQRHLEEAIACLDDAEVLMERAVRIHDQQEQILPLFKYLSRPGADDSPPVGGGGNEDADVAIADASTKSPPSANAANAESGGGQTVAKSTKKKKHMHHEDLTIDANGICTCPLELFLSAITALMCGTFEQKFNFYFQLFDMEGEGFFSSDFITKVLMTFSRMFYRLRIIPYRPVLVEIQNCVQRGFMELGLNFHLDKLTLFETKQFIITFISHSENITKILGINQASHEKDLTTYQRNKMTPIALLLRGMIGPKTCQYRIHYEVTRFKPHLEPRRKQLIHEAALAMGTDDPNKVDYNKFIVKPVKVAKLRLDPLRHGHLNNVNYILDQMKNDAATKLQSLYRSFRGRKVSELAVKHRAFMDAKEMAMKEMKNKIMTEFKNREAGTGVGKMKWDAQVRMKQAKLRANGQSVSRSDIVMLMIEEAITKAKAGIESRFKKIEQLEDFAGIKFETPELPKDEVKEMDISQLFGVIFKPAVDESAVMIEGISTPRPDGDEDEKEEDEDDHSPEAEARREARREERERKDSAAEEKRQRELSVSSTGNETRMTKILEGRYFFDPNDIGESILETDLRLKMCSSQPPADFMYNRLRMINKYFTLYKAREFLGELPTKRLIVRFVESMHATALANELTAHFKHQKGQKIIADILKNMVRSDRERGLMLVDLKKLQKRVEAGLHLLHIQLQEKAISDINYMVKQRMETNELAKEDEIINNEVERLAKFVKKYRTQVDEVLGDMATLKEKYKRFALSCKEVERKYGYAFEAKERLENGGFKSEPEVSFEERTQWVLRMSNAEMLPEETPEQIQIKYGEIRSCCQEFLDLAVSDALIIISEHHQPKHAKTIQVCEEFNVHGRKESARGVSDNIGKYYTYEAHNIVYRVCEDYNGIFDGNDEYAAKAAGKDRLGSLEYFKCHVPRLNIPFTATIDFCGYRVLAVSKLPSERAVFSDEGELRKLTEEMVHGVAQDGEVFYQKSKMLMGMLRQAAFRLNLAEHTVKGSTDISSQSTFASSEIKAYKGFKDEFYLKDFWRALPPEAPEATPHLPRSSRDQSIFWRQLRPEFVRGYIKALSPDAGCLISLGTSNFKADYDNVVEATTLMVNERLPQFAEELMKRVYELPISEGLGIDLTLEMHSRGFNMRHLGLLRSKLWRECPGTINLFVSESFVRTSLDMREEISEGDKLLIDGKYYTVTPTPKNRITVNRIPIDAVYVGKAITKGTMRAGKTSTINDTNAQLLRYLILSEMIARTIKSIVRLQMRNFARSSRAISTQLFHNLIVDYLNVITGSNPDCNDILQETIFEGIRERFGPDAIRPSERTNLHHAIQPCIIYIVKRLQVMFGTSLSLTCLSEFHERPLTFSFTTCDLVEVVPVLRHNIPHMAFADAALITLQADRAAAGTYVETVLSDKPSLFLRMSERKGNRAADNAGTLGSAYGGFYSSGIELELPGPIPNDPYTKSCNFRPGYRAILDTKFHKEIVPQTFNKHFSVECFVMCCGGNDNLRIAFISGRYGLVVSRENWWTFVVMQGQLEVYLRICPVEQDKWVHLIATFDGITLRIYVNSLLTVATAIDVPMRLRQQELQEELKARAESIDKEEAKERATIKAATQAEAETFFKSKEGVSWAKRAQQAVMESMEFQAENHGAGAATEAASIAEKKAAALNQARTKYTTDLYLQNVRESAERFKLMRAELADKERKDAEEAAIRVHKALRFGSALSTGNTKEGKNYFHGRISSVSVYTKCLSVDRIRAHYLASILDQTRDARRLYTVSSTKYAEALVYAGEDHTILRGYAKALCKALCRDYLSPGPKGEEQMAQGKYKVLEAVEMFRSRALTEGIAEIFMALPQEYAYRTLACACFNGIWSIDKGFFSRGLNMTRKDLVHIPHHFGLDLPSNPPEITEVAALIFREVVRDTHLTTAYGEMDLSFVTELQCHELVVAIVKHAVDDLSLHVVKIGEFFASAGRSVESINILDTDVVVLAAYLVLSIGFDLSGCRLITNLSLSYITRVKALKILNLDGCILIDDKGLKALVVAADRIEVLVLANLPLITDQGLEAIGTACHRLKILNVSKCPQISYESLAKITPLNRRLNTLAASATLISDAGLSHICGGFTAKEMTSLDVSFCREITDFSIITLADQCPNLKFLNLTGLSRITDEGMRAICAKCWHLVTLIAEDVFLLNDDAFWFDREYDGRRAADENMLTSLVTLNLRDCVNITDHAILGLAQRCVKMEHLVIRGCDKLTNTSLYHMYTPQLSHKYPMCDSFRSLDVSYCAHIDATAIIELLRHCGVLEKLDIGGLTDVNDTFLLNMCQTCPTILHLHMHGCQAISDVGLCTIADYLWLETLDISACTKISDEGIEVITAACNGMFQLNCKRLRKLSRVAMLSIMRNCKSLQTLNVEECPLIDQQSLDDLMFVHPNLRILK